MFAQTVNDELARVVKGESFATALCGVIDAQRRTLRSVSAGGPPGLAMRADGTMEELEASGLPFGMMEDAEYEEMEARFDEGDCLLFFSDGAVEVHNAQDKLLGTDGLVRILQESWLSGVRTSDQRRRGAAIALLQRHPAYRRSNLHRSAFLKCHPISEGNQKSECEPQA